MVGPPMTGACTGYGWYFTHDRHITKRSLGQMLMLWVWFAIFVIKIMPKIA